MIFPQHRSPFLDDRRSVTKPPACIISHSKGDADVLRARAPARGNEDHLRSARAAAIAVEFRDPDDHHLEIYCFLDQVGSDGRVRPPEEWREETSLEDAIKHPAPGQDTTLHGR
jgi:hypothetical protein